jgi:formate hydrogenlyase subunit 3/multisubunit Na+/H+ antiporter MnhD subunit
LAVILSLSSLALIGSMAILCFTKAFSIIFLGAPRSEVSEHVQEDVSKKAIMPMAVLVLFVFLIGLFPQYVLNGIFLPVEVLIGQKFEFSSTVMGIMQIISYVSFVFLFTVGLLIFLKYKLTKGKIFEFETWGCVITNQIIVCNTQVHLILSHL